MSFVQKLESTDLKWDLLVGVDLQDTERRIPSNIHDKGLHYFWSRLTRFHTYFEEQTLLSS